MRLNFDLVLFSIPLHKGFIRVHSCKKGDGGITKYKGEYSWN